eukprot:1138943-Pelagomonas_calceolata.AAC.1
MSPLEALAYYDTQLFAVALLLSCLKEQWDGSWETGKAVYESALVVFEPLLLWDGSWESGKAVYKNALVALEPLTEVRLAKSTSVTIDSA